MTEMQAWGFRGTWNLSLGLGSRWAPCLQEVCTDGRSVSPRKGAAGGDRQTVSA